MSVGDTNKVPSSGGTMSDHLKKYRDYIDELKQGRSSGISAAFGRATDLLPPEVMAIKAEPVDLVAQIMELDSNVLADGFDRDYLNESVQALVQAYADDLDGPVGTTVTTDSGTEVVLSVYVENGVRMFMLSDLSTIDEGVYQRTVIADAADSDEVESHDPVSTEDMVDDAVEPASHLSSQSDFPSSSDFPSPQENIAQPFVQSVATVDGMPLWQVHYSPAGPELVSMADGGIIKRAEGRQEYVFSKLSAADGDIKFFILSGFVVDPGTGNVYFEANEGAYTAAFLNNGWTIHQYLSCHGDETFFVTEPVRADRLPITMKVKSIDLDLTTGEVTYETMDSAASITLKSRKLSS